MGSMMLGRPATDDCWGALADRPGRSPGECQRAAERSFSSQQTSIIVGSTSASRVPPTQTRDLRFSPTCCDDWFDGVEVALRVGLVDGLRCPALWPLTRRFPPPTVQTPMRVDALQKTPDASFAGP